ncbi:MAG TPA: tRNA (guanosine(46)-N7)-methyltransferase TrmB [Bacilli bacterium]|nr:tRNA (guanosine(46)-N7)-methyltransferase TrmB [Bacilli bacterium]
MRLRNVKDKENILNKSKYVLKDINNLKGNWNKIFNNNNPIHLEIGTGKCKFLIENAINYPNINFVGIEKSDSILALGVKDIDDNLNNLYFINIDADGVDFLFCHEISMLYLNFSDPWPKKRHTFRRLTSPIFLKKYDNIFKDRPYIIQKTDNKSLFEYSIISFSEYGYKIADISLDMESREDIKNIKTEYEDKFSKKGQPIYMVKVEKY